MRITDKNGLGKYIVSRELLLAKKITLVVADEIINKLGQLEDIEEKLGIDLTALYKAVKYGYYYKNNDKIEFVEPNDEGLKEILYGYGKTWALTKEELL